MTPAFRRTLLLATALLVTAAPLARAAERAQVDTKYTWDLSALFADDAAWAKARADLAKRIPGLAAYKGKLGNSAADLYTAITAYEAVQLDLDKLGTYASQRADEDNRNSAAGEMRQAAQQMGVMMSTTVSYFRPELIALGP